MNATFHEIWIFMSRRRSLGDSMLPIRRILFVWNIPIFSLKYPQTCLFSLLYPHPLKAPVCLFDDYIDSSCDHRDVTPESADIRTCKQNVGHDVGLLRGFFPFFHDFPSRLTLLSIVPVLVLVILQPFFFRAVVIGDVLMFL